MATNYTCPCAMKIEELTRELKVLREKDIDRAQRDFLAEARARGNRHAWERALTAVGIRIQEGKVIRSHSS